MTVIRRDADVLASFLEDAAHFAGGHAAGLATPANDAEVVEVVRAAPAVLPIGAQSSLTGGATPMGEVLLSTSKLNRILEIGADFVRVQAGVTLTSLDTALAAAGKYYPPTPTFMGACVGGTIATNAAGAATFRHGVTRHWVQGLRVVLATGEILDLVRGQTPAATRVRVPTYRPPEVAKCSAGYFAAANLDLIDLFIGSEGTLGVITEATLRVLPTRPSRCLAFVTLDDRSAALRVVEELRRQAARLSLTGIEHMDGRCVSLLREDAIDRRFGVTLPATTEIALLMTLELPPAVGPGEAYDQIGRAMQPTAPDTPLVRLCRALEAAGLFDRVDIAVPGDDARAAQLLGVREAVPAAVNARIGAAKARIDARISKTAADMIVPFARLGELMSLHDDEFGRRGLEAAIWGHISDGNLHPNVLPHSFADVESGRQAILTFGRAVLAMGGSPLAEHGVGRNPIKIELLREMYGEAGIDQMRAVKRALDPGWKLAPGVLFTPAG